MDNESPPLLPHVSARMAAAAAVLLALLEVFVDWTTDIDLNVAIIYGLPLVVAAAARGRRLLWGLAAFLVFTTFAVYYVQMPRSLISLSETHFLNRVLCGTSLILTASLLNLGLIAADILDAQHQSLKKQNEDLDRRRCEAEEASSRKMRLMASVSHDIRTPVHAINLMAETICLATHDPDLALHVPEVAHRLQANALALTQLVSDVLDIARLDSGKIEVHASEIELQALLKEVYETLLPIAQAKNLHLKVEAADPVSIRTDRVKLTRILGNLAGNALKFTKVGMVTITTSVEDSGEVLICIRDTGIGIGQEQLAHIFDEFFQLNNPGRDRDNGCGLGLAICRRLADAIGGRIAVESDLGRGSAFTVRLSSSCLVSAVGCST